MKTLNGNHTGNPRFLIYTVGTTASDLTWARTASGSKRSGDWYQFGLMHLSNRHPIRFKYVTKLLLSWVFTNDT